MIANVAKIDLCSSKKFASRNEAANPEVRASALKKLLEVSKRAFPSGEEPFPKGSFYKADGDAVYYILETSSVALRGCIEFMQDWYHESGSDYPECRVFIDRGFVNKVDVPGKTELTGKVFENISVFEKDVDEGKVYLTKEVLDNCDQTMAKFVFYNSYIPRPSEKVAVYYVDFLDPRTVADSSLVHALFVAHGKAAEARETLFGLFLVEHLLEKGEASDLQTFVAWAQSRNYPLPPIKALEDVILRSDLLCSIQGDRPTRHQIRPEKLSGIEEAKEEFRQAQEDCVKAVSASIVDKVGSDEAVRGLNLGELVEQYLCAVFSEIRMMANYFRHTFHLFESGPEVFRRFDYILKRRLSAIQAKYFGEWKDGFLWGLKTVSEKNNMYIAAVFHNVLATYYLNRSTQASAYQIDKLRQRQIYIDTNVLYSLMVPASNYHDVATRFVGDLMKMGVRLKVFPFTLEEYEHSLLIVEREFRNERPSDFLVRWNPWLYQEYQTDPRRYLKSMAVCRQNFSIVKNLQVEEKSYDEIDRRLQDSGLMLERAFTTYSEEQVKDLWVSLRNAMTSPKWDLFQYWEFIYAQAGKSEKVIRHDVSCIENVREKSKNLPYDQLGPIIMFLTTDSKKLLRLRKKYPFILSPEQFLEFILPYLFLSDIPLTDAEKFPNQLLSAQLGTLLVRKPPELAEMAEVYLKRPDFLGTDPKKLFAQAGETAQALNNDRFRKIVKMSELLDDAQKVAIAEESARVFGEIARIERHEYFKSAETEAELAELKAQLAEKDKKIEKLHKTIGYWRQHARR